VNRFSFQFVHGASIKKVGLRPPFGETRRLL
jgi:hypothetical protein